MRYSRSVARDGELVQIVDAALADEALGPRATGIGAFFLEAERIQGAGCIPGTRGCARNWRSHLLFQDPSSRRPLVTRSCNSVGWPSKGSALPDTRYSTA